jgi:hypothetical protein
VGLLRGSKPTLPPRPTGFSRRPLGPATRPSIRVNLAAAHSQGLCLYTACNPYISAPSYRGKRLVVHAVLVTCPVCKDLIAPARAQKESGT